MKKLLKALAHRFGFEVYRLPPGPAHTVVTNTMPPDSDVLMLRSFADRAAQFSSSSQQSEAISNLYLSGILREQPAVDKVSIEIGDANSTRVGIWRKQSPSRQAPFVRMADSDWSSWARTETIEPKRGKWRVALIGESVARGFLYDPDLTPASVLQQMLRIHLGSAQIDVVDLAVSSLTMQPLKELIGQSLALSPDVIVVFAGNNWHMQLTDADIPYVDGILRTLGAPGLKAYIDTRIRHAVRQLTEQVTTLVQGKEVRLIWVIPETNLDDWHDPISTAPVLPKQGNARWRELDLKARQALGDGDLALAEKLAQEMVSLDGGTNAVPLRLLAECSRRSADLAGTRRYLELCRDAEGWNPSFHYSPRTSVTIQTALREAAAAPGQIIVDLPQLFGRYLAGRPPNRRLFLDYCHLTAEGMGLAMAAIGTEVLKSIGRASVPIEQLQSDFESPSGQVEGKAALLAAIHNAHFYQGYEIASHWCERALRCWPESAQIMQQFIDFQTRRGELMACRSAIELSSNPEFVTLIRNKKRLDLSLIDAMVGALAAAGTDIRRHVADLRAQEHALGTGAKELTDFYYSSAMIRPSETGWTSKSFFTNVASHSIYSSAFSDASKFVLFGARGRPVGLKLTYRVPGQHPSAGIITIEVNGQALAQAPAGSRWQTLELCVLGESVVDGLNEIVIRWPEAGESSEVLLNRAADALLVRRMPRFYRVFGEIHSLLAFDPLAPVAPTDARSGVRSERSRAESTRAAASDAPSLAIAP